jgi:hypothetical protein
MFNHSQDDASVTERLTAGLLVRDQLERVGLGAVADLFGQPSLEDRPSVTINRRRARPFTEMEATVVADEDARLANDLLSLTRNMHAETAEQKKKNQQLIAELMIREGLR